MEIIRLLKSIVSSINENSQLIKDNNELIKNNHKLVMQALQKSGSGDMGQITDALKKSVDALQKGVQILELQRAVQDIRQMMGMVSSAPTQNAPKMEAAPTRPNPKSGQKEAVSTPVSQPAPQPKKSKSDEEDGLLKPSDLFG